LKKPGQHIRLTFLLFAFAFAAFGLSVRASSPPSPFYTLTGLYKTVQPIDSDTTKELRELTQSKVFQDSVEGQVEVSKGKEPDTIRIRTGASNDKELSARHRMAVNLVSKNLKKIALREKNQILQFLGTAGDEEALSDQARKAILKDKIKQLESFVDGGPAPRIVPLSLDRSALESARRRLQGSAAESTAKDDLESTRKDLEHLEKEIAKVYIKALRLELSTLSTDTSQEKVPTHSDSELNQRVEELALEINALEQSADLSLLGDLERSQDHAPQIAQIVCWLAALLSLLAALFYVPPPKKPRQSEKASSPTPKHQTLTPVVRVEWNDLLPGMLARHSGSESFFHEIHSEMEHYLGRPPRRFLVLGDAPVDSRLSFSLRLANSLASEGERVRLIDFDLSSKRLTKRLGRQSLPGVGDLLVEGGPVDEFFSSIAGTHVQFAPAGCTRVIADAVDPAQFERILGETPRDIAVIDASSASPLHLVVRMIDVVLCTTQSSPGMSRSHRETQVLVAFRDAGLPVWGVSPERNQFFPLL
jgi:hypothetical protein